MSNKELSHAARMCPICGADSRVYYTREAADGTIRRKRRCPACGTCFITAESIVDMVRMKHPSRSRA